MKKLHALLPVVFLVILYFLYVTIVFKPFSFNNFSLIDDGQTILYSDKLISCIKGDCSGAEEVLVEKEFGRFRPMYWILQTIQYVIFGLNAQIYHVFRIYILGIILSILVYLNLKKYHVIPIISIFASAVFFLNFSFTENIIRLGPTEPYVLIIIGIISLILAKSKITYKDTVVITVLMAIAQLIKEISFVFLLPISYLLFINGGKEKVKQILLISFITIFLLIAGRVIARPDASSIAYSSFYEIGNFLDNLKGQYSALSQSLSPFLKISLLLLAVGIFIRQIRKYMNIKFLIFWFLSSFAFFFILVPWSFVLERYLLLVVFSFSVILGLLMDSYIKGINTISKNRYHKIALITFAFFVVSHLFSSYFGLQYPKNLNYTSWYRTFTQFEHDQVEAIAIEIERGNKVYINAVDHIDNWEVLFEIPLHLSYLRNISDTPKLLDAQNIPNDGVLFHRSPFVNAVDNTTLQEFDVVYENKYEVSQIDPLLFRNSFKIKPVSTLVFPPLKDDKFKYQWQIYRLNN